MHTIEQQYWQCLPEHAQQEVYDFFLFIKQRYEGQSQQKKRHRSNVGAFKSQRKQH